ncbi:hypothetical protein E2C01_090856 [Portunus trituberculatus]|uniref:Uncharacterized protein n=1 Tax=Portunus trituberculatus TaxID=210409 RepID=A0A5B7JRB7_PORTR|nr:hypothetical protein [Portunus trituberculatus]
MKVGGREWPVLEAGEEWHLPPPRPGTQRRKGRPAPIQGLGVPHDVILGHRAHAASPTPPLPPYLLRPRKLPRPALTSLPAALLPPLLPLTHGRPFPPLLSSPTRTFQQHVSASSLLKMLTEAQDPRVQPPQGNVAQEEEEEERNEEGVAGRRSTDAGPVDICGGGGIQVLNTGGRWARRKGEAVATLWEARQGLTPGAQYWPARPSGGHTGASEKDQLPNMARKHSSSVRSLRGQREKRPGTL